MDQKKLQAKMKSKHHRSPTTSQRNPHVNIRRLNLDTRQKDNRKPGLLGVIFVVSESKKGGQGAVSGLNNRDNEVRAKGGDESTINIPRGGMDATSAGFITETGRPYHQGQYATQTNDVGHSTRSNQRNKRGA